MSNQPKDKFKTYSCRFECSEDYTTFVVAAHKRDVLVCTSEANHDNPEGYEYPLPDFYVGFRSDADLETLQGILRKGPDLHVGLQTLRQVPLKDNSLERDYALV